MGLRDTLYFWSLTLLTLPGVLGANWGVWYPDKPVCAVRGSTVIIPCSYSYPQSDQHGTVRGKRVMWCHNNRNCIESEYVCHSNNTKINPEFKSRAEYLGDTWNNCTLKINNITSQDSGTYRFRFEAEKEGHKWTGPEGVELEVTELTVTVTSSRGNETIREGDSVTLTCIAKNCSLGQSELTWLKDKQHLPGTNATLELSPFHSRHSGIYACAVKDNLKFTSPEIQLGNNSRTNTSTAVMVTGILLAALAVAVLTIYVKRRKATQRGERTQAGHPDPHNDLYTTLDLKCRSPDYDTLKTVRDAAKPSSSSSQNHSTFTEFENIQDTRSAENIQERRSAERKT